jgi:uncharacterized protein
MSPRVFIDSSVLITAIYSARGYSFDLLLLGVKEEITVIISDDVIDETMKNVAKDRPDKLPILQQALHASNFEVVTVTKENVLDAAKHIVEKDAPILAAAKVSNVDMLVSLDKKHFLGKPELSTYINAPVLTPAEAFQKIKDCR